MNRKVRWYVCLFAALAVIPLVVSNKYFLRILVLSGIYTILVTGQTLFMGYTGQISVCQAALYGVGAYTSALLTMRTGLPFLLALPAAGLVALLFGVVIGIPCLRLKGNYLAMATLGFGQVLVLLAMNLDKLTGGPSGITGIPPASIGSFRFDSIQKYYWLVLGMIALVLILTSIIARSRAGFAFRALADNDTAAESLGVNVYMWKVVSFAISSLFAGFAGCLYAHLDLYIAPDNFGFPVSAMFNTMAVVGGLGNVVGGAVGALTLTVVGERLRFLERSQMMFYGASLVLLLIFLPEGVVSLPRLLMRKFRNYRSRQARA